MQSIGLMVGAFLIMEPITAFTHRFVMHGFGWRLHKSHHSRDWTHRWEANDAFPVMFAAVVCIGLAIGFNVDGFAALVPIGIGITAYGAAYAFVHDIYIHRRLTRGTPTRLDSPAPASPSQSTAGLPRLAAAHRAHHATGGAPYGMLVPVLARGSRPSHKPVDA